MKKIDLHNDLLYYLANKPQRTPYDDGLECSIPQMILGEIAIQILAIFQGPTEDSEQLFKQYRKFKDIQSAEEVKTGAIAFYPAIEGAEQLLYPSPLGTSINQTLSQLVASDAKPIYVSLTWLYENSFGGGDRTTIGLKNKGKELLRMLSDYNIAVDLSHASDELASDIIEFREANKFQNGLLVSHTNFRALHSTQRNVSDDVARYVAKTDGVLGLSFSRMQIGLDNPLDIPKQLDHARSLSNEVSNAMCLGGDLFHQGDLPESYRIKGGIFPPELSTAGDYAKLDHLGADVLYNNAATFLTQFGLIKAPTLL